MRASTFLSVILLCGLSAAACASERSKGADDDEDGSGGGASSTTSGPGGSSAAQGGQTPGGPQIASFSVDPSAFDPYNAGDGATFVAEVSDPDGSADIVVASLEGSSGVQYGEFLKSGGGSTFALTLTTEELTLEPIEFVSGSIMRTFVARFVDQAGHEATANLQLEISCNAGMYGWCGEDWCVDTTSDAYHCGTCGKTCTGSTPYCQNSQCTGF